MANLRHRTSSSGSIGTQEKKRKSDEIRPTAHVEHDDWLEDDLGINSAAKKRKSSNATIDNLLYTSNARRTPSESTDSDVESRIEMVSEGSEDGFIMKPKSKRKTQISLISAGFSRKKTSPKKTTHQPLKTRVDKSRMEADSSSSLEVVMPCEVKQTQMLSVDVRIEEKLYRVPISASEINSRTIKWLAEEAAKRYFKCVLKLKINLDLYTFCIFKTRRH